jgi:cbb3-type cytochrome oxidase maturation protein
MTNTLIFIWTIVILLAATSVAALVWAVVSGQFGEFQKGATSIFDDEEPIGQMTDSFPEQDKWKVSN